VAFKENSHLISKLVFTILFILILMALSNANDEIITEYKGVKNMTVEHLSLVTTPILLLDGNKIVSQGTGFYYGLEGQSDNTVLFLVTNYHVLTGYSPGEKKSPKGDNILFYLHKDAKNTGDVKEIRYPLFTKNRKPVWLGSLDFPKADIAVIPLVSSIYKDAKVFAISKKWIESDIKLRPTSTITLIGYPYGYYDKNNQLPIWKTGTIASEPSVDFEGKPLFLADISVFPGMSGSPAFSIASGFYESIDGTIKAGNVKKFLGVYASTQILEEKKYLEEIPFGTKKGVVIHTSLELGHIWKVSLINKITEGIDVKKYESEIVANL